MYKLQWFGIASVHVAWSIEQRNPHRICQCQEKHSADKEKLWPTTIDYLESFAWTLSVPWIQNSITTWNLWNATNNV